MRNGNTPGAAHAAPGINNGVNMNAEIEGNELVIRIPLEKEPRLSSTGKTLIVARTNGFKATDAVLDGEKVAVTITAVVRVKQGGKK